MKSNRRNHYDVTDTVRISHPGDVGCEIMRLVGNLHPQADLGAIDRATQIFARLYSGSYPGYHGCDTWYHDAQHSLDCALAYARLLDGHERSVAASDRLGPRRAVLGVVISLFHDAGYIRRKDESAANGAEFTLTHVSRSADFLAQLLPRLGFADDAELTRQIVHFTGYEIELDKIRVTAPKDRTLGFLIGTADILAQTADRCYLEKCRDFLFREFEICGLAGNPDTASVSDVQPQYENVEALLTNTPAFNQQLWKQRLDGYFGSVHQYMEAHFGGRNPYAEQIDHHLALIAKLIRTQSLHKLTKRPDAIDAAALRQVLKTPAIEQKAGLARAA